MDTSSSLGSSLAHQSLGATSVLVHSDCTPDNAEFERWIDEIVAIRVERVLVFAKSAGPTPTQRKAMLSRLDAAGLKPKTAIITGSAAARGIVTAIGWFSTYELRAFAESDIDGALRFLEASAMRDNILRAASGLHQHIDGALQNAG